MVLKRKKIGAKTKAIKISSLPKDSIKLGQIADRDINLDERIQDFKESVLHPFVKFFTRVNLIVLGTICIVGILETLMIVLGFQFERIITDKVLIAVVVAVAAQTAAIIIAAFKGLFGGK